MANVKTTAQMPKYDKNNIKTYVDDLWKFVTEPDKKIRTTLKETFQQKKKKDVVGKVGAGGATGDKLRKPINKRDDKGNRLWCKLCKSY